MPKKQCKYCQKWYSEDQFGVALTTPTKVFRRRKCRFCYYLTKKSLHQRHYVWINTYKEKHGCYKCGIKDYRVLDLHHKDEGTKEFGIAGFRRSVGFDRLKAELKKCVVLCSNCHRILHSEQREGSL